MNLDRSARAVQLASDFNVGDYLDALELQNKPAIADAIHRRFYARYLLPASLATHRGGGFTMMAIACLMIEALESFRRGWPETPPGKGKETFCSFFHTHDDFASFRPQGPEFYEGVRCGILHQAETTLGWRIHQSGTLLTISDDGVRTINARAFVKALGRTLDGYRNSLYAADWEDNIWKNLRRKMEQVCANCSVKSPDRPMRRGRTRA